MTTREFIKTNCVGTFCPDYDRDNGCRAYDGEECDEAFTHPLWRGKSMRERVDVFCLTRRAGKNRKPDIIRRRRR
jgi:hypothetical protein